MSGMSGVDITTLTGNTGGVIDAAVSGNFNIIGSGLVTVTGTPSTNTLTITSTGGVAGQTNHAVIVGTVAGSIASLAANGTTGQLLTGVTGADPAWTTATYPSTVAKGDVLIASANNIVNIVNDVTNAGYVLTVNVGAAPSFQAPSSGTTFASDAETIAGTVTNKAVAPSNLKAKLGTQTIHALPIGTSDSAALGWLTVGATGKYLRGVSTADPTWSTLTLPNDVTAGDVLVATSDHVIGVVNGNANPGYVLTSNATGAPTFQVGGSGGGIGTLDGDSGSATGATVTIAGTTDQITTTGDNAATITLSVPSTFTSPGSVTATTVITAGTGITATSGAITATSGNVVISAGNLALPATNDALTQGVITLNSSAFLHYGHNTTNVILGIGAGQSGNTNALYNTYVGQGAGAFSNINPTNGAAIYNVAIGYQAIGAGSPGGNSNTSSNVAVGAYSLQNIGWNGNHNIGIGYGAGMKLAANNCGDNVMIGYGALTAAVGTDNGNSIGSNVFIGDYSATAITNGTTGGINSNTFVGRASGGGLTTGSIQHNAFFGDSTGSTLTTGNVQYNIFLGSSAGNSYPAASVPVSCICIGYASGGSGTETNVLRIGNATGTSAGNLNAAYICGIQGITVTGTAVLISATDQLGIAVSSAKYKKDITDMPDMSQVIDKLRPVTFHYKDEKQSAQLNYGLIAEEVEQVWPEMVAYDKDGNINTLYYQFLAPVLLKEIQSLRGVCDSLRKELEELKGKING